MADPCGGVVATQWVTIGPEPVQIASALEQRRRITVRANPGNSAYIYLTAAPGTGWREGFPLYAGEAYQLDGPGAKAALYALTSGGDNLIVHVISEGL